MSLARSDCRKPLSDDELAALPRLDPESAEYLRAIAHLEECEPCSTRRDALDTSGSWVQRKIQPPPPPELTLGITVGEYTVLEKVAGGGQGVVYRVHDAALDRDVALKLSTAAIDPESAGRFRAEARAHAGLTHPHIAPLHSFGIHEGRPFIVMELARTSLSKALYATAPAFKSAAAAAAMVEQLAEAVEYAHGLDIHHRDLKPQNILLTFGTDPTALPTVKLTDFGLTGAGEAAGSPNYIAPEIAEACVGESSLTPQELTRTVSRTAATTEYDGFDPINFVRIDVYGLGAILHEVLTGDPPYPGKDGAKVIEAVADPTGKPILARPCAPSRVGAIPPTLRAIALKCLARDPAARYPSAAAVADDLRRFREREPTIAYPKNRLARMAWRSGLWCRRRPAQAALLAVLLLLAVGGPVAAAEFYAIAQERDAKRLLAEEKERDALNAAAAEHQAKLREAAQKVIAIEQRAKAEAEENIARSRAASLAFERGLTLAIQTKPGEGLPWMVRALDLAPADDPIREPILYNIAHWLHRAPRLQAVIPHEKLPYGLAFHPDGKRLYSCGEGGRLQGWNPATGKPVGAPVDLPASVERLLFGKDGKTLYAPGTDGKLYRFAAEGDDLRPLPTWEGHHDNILAVAITPDGKHIATGGKEGILLVRETETGEAVVGIKRHKRNGKLGSIRDVAFSPDGKRIATAGWDGSVRVSDWEDGKNELILDHEGPLPWAVCFLPVGRRTFVVSADFGGGVCVWDEKGNRLPMGLKLNGAITRLVPRPGELRGQVLITGYGEAARIWVGNTQDISAELAHPKPVEGAAWAPDGGRLATASPDGVRVWHMQATGTTDPLDFAGLGEKEIWTDGSSTVSPAGNRVAVTELGAKGRVWVEAITPEGVKTVPGPPQQKVGITSVRFSRDGRLLLLGALDGSVRLWDFDKNEERWRTPAFKSDDPKVAFPRAVRAVNFAPDGVSYAAGDLSGRLVLGHADTGAATHTATVDGTKPFDLMFTPDGKQVVVASLDKSAGLLTWWDTATGKEIGPRRQLLNAPQAVDLSPDGRVVVVAGLDRRVTAWDMTTHDAAGPDIRLPAGASSVRFSPDGRLLLTVGSDDTARLWHWGTGRPIGMPFKAGVKSGHAGFTPERAPGRRLRRENGQPVAAARRHRHRPPGRAAVCPVSNGAGGRGGRPTHPAHHRRVDQSGQ